MNRILFTSTALGLVLSAGTASAQITITLGGDQYFEFGYVDKQGNSPENAFRKTEIRDRVRLTVNASGKTDNGLEYGVRTRIRLRQQGVLDFDRSWAFVGGEWGQIQFGTTTGVDDRQKVFAPNDYGTGGVDGSALEWFNGSVPASTPQRTGGDLAPIYSYAATKSTVGLPASADSSFVPTRISYYSPRVAGFEFGVSYAPMNDSSGTDINRNNFGGTNTVLGAPGFGGPITQNSINYNFKDIWEAGVNYNDKFAGVLVKANAAVISGNTKDSFQLGNGLASSTTAPDAVIATHHPLFGFQTGIQAGYAGFTVGGGYMYFGNSGLAKPAVYNHADQYAWNVGIQYAVSAYVVGAAYQHVEDPGSPFGAGAKKLDHYVTGARYIVTNGFDLNVEYNRLNLRNNGASGAPPEVDANIVLFRSNIAF
jgi:outer membrane protein OmpU